MKNQQKIITQIEIKIKDTWEKIDTWEQQISAHKRNLLELSRKLEEIKNNMKITNSSLKGSNNNK